MNTLRECFKYHRHSLKILGSNSFLQQFYESYKDGDDMGCLEVIMYLEIHFFLIIVVVYIFMGISPSCPVVTKGQKILTKRNQHERVKNKTNWYITSKYLCIS